EEKTKIKGGKMTVKTKKDDGKVKVKTEAKDGSKMKATTKPGKGANMKGVKKSTATTTPSLEGSIVDAGEIASPYDTNSPSASTSAVGGYILVPTNNLVANALWSSDHTFLVAGMKIGGLIETLEGAGPFTVFAPTNDAFNKLSTGPVNTLLVPENKQKLNTILTYHIVPGRLTVADLVDGQKLTTMGGETLTVIKKNSFGFVMLKDAKGGMATVTIPNVISSNGVMHVVDIVLMPTK
ncbi:MAG TPA: fasciclin domain-containing protein, partial [Hymenobacter sp.]|nr:fasciclin domain-containing protein [Hymenobacter sp.]